jgi:hypothetical protein
MGLPRSKTTMTAPKEEAPKPPRWVRYGYFVKLRNGHCVPAGNDFGPTENTYKVGDSMGVKNGKEGIIVDVEKGEFAKLAGFDVLIVIEEREPKKQ